MVVDILLWVSGFLIGVLALFAYQVKRMMSNKDWDDSNITNALRLLSHVVMHPHDFGKMVYVTLDAESLIQIEGRPFWYASKDELSEVVKTRP